MHEQKLKSFALLVERMRSSQRDYFKYRQQPILQKSKALEKRVDNEILLIFSDQPTNGNLFDKEEFTAQ